ncbi:MAG: chemotaxis protein CheB [Myxococcaceae bacterium]
MIRILIVEDSPTVRKHLSAVFAAANDFEVVGQAATGEEAVQAVEALKPTLVSLDVFLPDATAAEVVKRILAKRQVPIVLLSDAERDGAEVFKALSAGALDFMHKPKPADRAAGQAMLASMRALSRVKTRPREPSAPTAGVPLAVMTVASSTGGPAALREMLSALPKKFPLPVLVAQHLAPGFEEGMARWLAQASHFDVRVAQAGERLLAGRVLLGGSGLDLFVSASGQAETRPAPARGYHPSADVLFGSAVDVFGGGVLGVVLSGIGQDGLKGSERVVRAGGLVLAQDRVSAAVNGMPGAVLRAGLASAEGAPKNLAASVVALLGQRGYSATAAGRAGE